MMPLSEQQALQHVDSEQIYMAWVASRKHVIAHKYGRRWVRSGGKDYLLRLTDAKGNGRSLGARSPKTESIYAEFQAGKTRAAERDKVLREKLVLQSRMN